MSKFPRYYTPIQKLGSLSLSATAYIVLAFLMLPILVIIPLSFNAEPFFHLYRWHASP